MTADQEADDPNLRSRGLNWLSAGPLWARIVAVTLILAMLAVLIVWIQRESIVRNLVESELEKQGIDARYEIDKIAVGEQIIRDLVIGDPDRPDLVIKRMVLNVTPGMGGVSIDRVRLEGARLYGRQVDGRISFGALDKYIYAESDAPPELPDMRLELSDARALIVTDAGNIGIKAEGAGHLRNGFEGELAAVGKGLSYQGCALGEASLFGAIAIKASSPRFTGPLRLDDLSCPEQRLSLADGGIQLDLAMPSSFDGAKGSAGLDLRQLGLGGNRIAALGGTTAIDYGPKGLTGTMDWRASDGAFGAIRAGSLALAGDFSASSDFADLAIKGDVSGRSLVSAGADWKGWRQSIAGLEATPIGPIAKKLLTLAQQRLDKASLDAGFDVSRKGDQYYALVDGLTLSGSDGSGFASAENLAINGRMDGGPPQISGLARFDGPGLPDWKIALSPLGREGTLLALTGSPYRADGASIAPEKVTIRLAPNGNAVLRGALTLTGPLPDGRVEGLRLPIDGRWRSSDGLALWDSCQTLSFASLRLSGLSAQNQNIRLCPNGGAILAQGRTGYRFAARLPDARFAGRIGESPLSIAAGSAELSLPGTARFQDANVLIGDSESGTRILVAEFVATTGKEIGGSFTGAEAMIGAVPLKLERGEGVWSFAEGLLSLDANQWYVLDRENPRRFEPLLTDNAHLEMADNRITASGLLKEPESRRAIMQADIAHDLGSGTGHADLGVAGIRFDGALQPEQISTLALGVIANVDGLVTGNGRIDWNPDGVTSSGRFRTTDMNLAAAFGPVTGLSGEIAFVDLLGLVTAPDQVVTLREINPGVAVNDGVVHYRIAPDFRMHVTSAEWPFAGGRLELKPTILALASDEPRNLNFTISGLDAAEFLQRLEFDNLNATGVFDGDLPMVFDQNGGRIEGGVLHARSQGGSLAYVGELTYEDLGAMGNYAFQALRSIRYRDLIIEMDGAIDGELVTKVRFDGLQQGEGASRNFITKQLEKLPIKFNVTIRAPFMQLMNSARSLYDTNYLRDPADLGLSIDARMRAKIKAEAVQKAGYDVGKAK
ncbi:MAG: YdbH domain-containing protein [Blastomonas sp.]